MCHAKSLLVCTLACVLLFCHDARAEDRNGPPWGPAAMSFELGVFGGVLLPSAKHELYSDDSPEVLFRRLDRVAPDVGLRVGFYPLRFLGAEIEGALMPARTRDDDKRATLYGVRGHLVLQAPFAPITPFLLAGGGFLGIDSGARILGTDLDGVAHVGIGIKAYVTRMLALRLEARDNITQGFGRDTIAMHWEALLGVSLVLDCRSEPEPAPVMDSDGDSVSDDQDQCPAIPGDPPLGCPPADRDGDGIPDKDDKCPDQAGIRSDDPERLGCPPPPPDSDGDGVPDVDDKCPDVAGDGPDGCLQDSDGDGIFNRDDKCPTEPETRNDYEDADGCPDELPEAVKRFTGTISGIAFDSGKATIKASSHTTLDGAAKVLSEYSALRVEISGHTDSTGSLESNMQLAQARSEAVKAYLVSKGVAADRIETRGAGPNEPVADNKTKEGRSKNRRIEFKLLRAAEAEPSAK